MTAAHRNNFLAPEPFIVARLQECLADMRPQVHVLTAADLALVKEENQPTPAVHVIWNGFRVLNSRADGQVSNLEHTWLIVSTVRNVRTLKTGEAARAEAGELAARAGAALMGFRPPNVAGPMRLGPGPGAGHVSGFVYVPLAFQVETVFTSANLL
ncbi:hypothetical protein ACDW_22760 [Acidovorax sp. DW039]|uniref:phage tail terminator protein n=1 Tax=Acidovorax sp. DW039 TaxID=3095606 RepID=UPI00308D1A53|nr:hypothetical protein ACDW_22760 [Acidovorax sp. DW039]